MSDRPDTMPTASARPLYEITIDVARAADLIAEIAEATEMDEAARNEAIDSAFESIERALPELRDKMDACARWLLHLRGMREAVRGEIARLKERLATIGRQIDAFERYLVDNLSRLEARRIELPFARLSLRRSERLIIEDEQSLPPDERFWRRKVIVAPDKDALKAAIKAGELQDGCGCRLTEHYSLQVK